MKKYFAGLCAIAKDESPFIREWIAYHYYIGFEKIYIYDNESQTPIRDIVSDFYDLKICDTYRLDGLSMQNTAYDLCLRDHGDEFEWLAFFDIDEFLCLKTDTDVRSLLYDYDAYPCLSVQWDLFSSSGHLGRPDGFVTLNYTESLGYNHNCKCILRPEKTTMAYSAHHFAFTDGYAVNPAFQPGIGAYALIATEKVCLNHYAYRSQQDFAEKLAKSDATYGTQNPRKWQSFYDQAGAATHRRTDIVATAQEVEKNLKNGQVQQRYNIILEDTYQYSADQINLFLLRLFSNNQLGYAEVLFSINEKRFSDNFDFMHIGMLICLKNSHTARAKRIVDRYIQTTAKPDGYLLLYEYKLHVKEESDPIFVFISCLSEVLFIPELKTKAEYLKKRLLS